MRRDIMRSSILAIALAIPYPIFLLMKGMSLTPHASDSSLSFHADAIGTALSGLFTGGSMGIVWYAIPFATLILLMMHRKKDPRIDASALRLGLWGLFALALILFTYIFTPNAGFLASGESYYRQLMIPAAMLTLWCCLLWNRAQK